MTERIRVLIADHHPIFRQGLATVLHGQEDMELVAMASDGAECVQKARELRPEVVVLGLNTPVKDGLTAIREIALEQPEVRLLVLASSALDEQVYSAFQAGALGFLLKDAADYQLVDGIRSVYHGTLVLHPTIARLMFAANGSSPGGGATVDHLTPRELDVLRLVTQGLLNKEIAKELHLTEQTVLTHVRNIFRKLHVGNRTQAAMYAREHGLA